MGPSQVAGHSLSFVFVVVVLLDEVESLAELEEPDELLEESSPQHPPAPS